jgi:hypothetical protein
MAESRRHDRAAAQLARQIWERGLSGRIVGSGRLCPTGGGATAAQFCMCTLPLSQTSPPPPPCMFHGMFMSTLALQCQVRC